MSKDRKCQECALQVRRLGNKPFFAAVTEDGLLELVDTLHRYGHDRARAVIDEALVRRFGEKGADCVPSSSDLWALCKADPAQFETAPVARAMNSEAARDCQQCFGSGWVIVTRRGIDGADRCPCGGAPPSFDAARSIPRPPKLSASEIETLKLENREFAARLALELAGKTNKPVAAKLPDDLEIQALIDTQNKHRLHGKDCICAICEDAFRGAGAIV